jgi:DNA polymerase III alpha subunit
VRLVGLLAAERRHRISPGETIAYLTFEDETGLLEASIDPAAYRRLVPVVTTPGPYLADGDVRIDRGYVSVRLTQLRPFYERHRLQID